MSIKRQATTELNHDNWDQEDSTEPEEMGTFKTASKDVLEKRVIRTAKRRSQISSDEPSKSVFSGFGGFNKVPQSSFDFLANLTNGNKPTNGQSPTKTDTPVSSNIFTNKPFSSSPSSGLFSMSGSTAFAAKPTLTKSPEGSLFGISTTNTSPVQSVFTSSKPDPTVNENPFKPHTSPSAVGTENKITNADVTTSVKFGMPSSSSVNKSLFSAKTDKPTLLSTQPVSNPPTAEANSAITANTGSNNVESNPESDSKIDKKQRYYTKIKALNESVSEWIKKHVDETPVCILSPIFRDYEKYIKEIKDEYYSDEKDDKNNENTDKTKFPSEEKKTPASNNTTSIFGTISAPNSAKTETTQSNPSGFGAKSSSFSFGINTTTSTTASTTGSSGFSFGIKSPISSTTSSPFSITTTSTTTASAPFSFGVNKTGFNFNATTPPKTDTAPENKEEEDEPPKVEFTPIVEENSVFDRKCKIFIKKDANFVDKGVGTLYIKKIEESGKHQLLVRANTNLGTVLLNLVLSSAIPTKRMGKNNVMIVCIPTPDAKPPPTPILIRVKTSQDADELLNTLDKYKS